MAGVNRSNVAVTDTFDTWRIRTNEVNTTLNEATNAKTANTIIFRDDSANYMQILRHLILLLSHMEQPQVQLQSLLVLHADSAKDQFIQLVVYELILLHMFESSLHITSNLQVDNNVNLVVLI